MFAINQSGVTSSTSYTTLWNGGDGVLYVSGTWNGATLTLSANDGGGSGHNFLALGSTTTLTADGIAGFTLSAGMTLKATVSGAGASTNLNIVVATKY